MNTLPSTSRTKLPDASATAIGKCRAYTRAFDSRLSCRASSSAERGPGRSPRTRGSTVASRSVIRPSLSLAGARSALREAL